MSTRRGGIYGSNNAELCPVCFKVLTTRFGAVSHYRAHVRKGELNELVVKQNGEIVKRLGMFQIPGYDFRWDRGPRFYYRMDDQYLSVRKNINIWARKKRDRLTWLIRVDWDAVKEIFSK